MGKYEEDAKQLLHLVGAKENIAAVSHCMTRMRFALVEPGKADIKAIELQPEIKALFDTGLVDLGYCGTYQDVIKDMTGSGNSHLYEHLTDIYKRFEDMKKRFG